MAILLYRGAQGQISELPLKPGVNRLGRSELNDLRVPDSSVSSNHCELRLEGDTVYVRDLGSTNGTAINQNPIQQGVLRAGQRLRVGSVELIFQGDGEAVGEANFSGAMEEEAPPVPVPIPEPLSEAAQVCQRHPSTAAQWQCSKCFQLFCEKCVVDGRKFGVTGVKFCPACHSKVNSVQAQAAEKKKEAKTFGSEMVAALKYPFRAEGLIILICGSIFFTLVSFAMIRVFLLGLMILIGAGGYLMAYSQRVIQSSAQGEDDPPGWPDLSDYLQDLVIPFFQAVGLVLLYLVPYLVAEIYLPEGELSTKIVTEGLLLVATFMMPMAWLAISMHESIVGLSPHFVIPSIVRIVKHYIVLFLLLQVVVRTNIYLEGVVDSAKVPILGGLIGSFVDLYFLTVISRMLGVVYFINRHKLQWF